MATPSAGTPSAAEAPRPRLPDGSESKYHGGYFGAYMAYKNEKLQEQFAVQAGREGQRGSRLFEGVSILVNGEVLE